MMKKLIQLKKEYEKYSNKELSPFFRLVDFIWRKKYRQSLVILWAVGIIFIFLVEFLVKLIVDIENVTFNERVLWLIYYSTAIIVFWYTRETYDMKQIQNKQIKETRKSTKYLEYQTRPIAWFFLMSKKTSKKDKDNIIIKNESNFKIFFYYKIKYSIDNSKKITSNNDPWSNPLHIYPARFTNYPNVLNLDKEKQLIKKAKAQNCKIRADIWYGLAPDFATKEIQEKEPEIWKFDLVKKTWSGPNGIEDTGFITLWPGEIGKKLKK